MNLIEVTLASRNPYHPIRGKKYSAGSKIKIGKYLYELSKDEVFTGDLTNWNIINKVTKTTPEITYSMRLPKPVINSITSLDGGSKLLIKLKSHDFRCKSYVINLIYGETVTTYNLNWDYELEGLLIPTTVELLDGKTVKFEIYASNIQ